MSADMKTWQKNVIYWQLSSVRIDSVDWHKSIEFWNHKAAHYYSFYWVSNCIWRKTNPL